MLEKSLCLRIHIQTCGGRTGHELQKQNQACVDVVHPERAQQVCDEPRVTCASPLVRKAEEGKGKGVLETKEPAAIFFGLVGGFRGPYF